MAVALALLAGCAEQPTTPGAETGRELQGAAVGPSSLVQALVCRVDAAAGTFACAPPAGPQVSADAGGITIGGQGTYVQLASGTVSTTGDTLSADVTVENLTVHPMATTDGSTAAADGVRVFFHTGPTNGVTVNNADGTGTFTASGQPYHEYSAATGRLGGDGVLSSDETSSAKTWEFDLNGQSAFSFSVYVSASLPDTDGILRAAAMTSGTSSTLYGGWGTSTSDIFAAGSSGTIRHYDGNGWSGMTSNTSSGLLDIWGAGTSAVWAVGSGGTIVHYDGGSWSSVTSDTNKQLWGVWGASSSDVFAVGNNGEIMHYDGAAWTRMTSGTPNLLYAAWGTGSSDVFAVGTSGTILHYDGTWSAMTSNTMITLIGVWGAATNDVYAVGQSGTVMHYNGTDWTRVDLDTSATLWGIWGASATNVYAVGQSGALVHGTR
jgi:hypothetical protein